MRSLKLRALAFVLALVQVVTPGLAALADAELQAASNSPAAAAHVESHGRPQCPRVHTDDCILCQYLTTNRCRPGPAVVPPVLRVASVAPVTNPTITLVGGADALPRTRAPPAARTLCAAPESRA